MKKRILSLLSPAEWLLWGLSVAAVLAAAGLFGDMESLEILASVVGVTSLVFNARGNPAGQALMLIFSIMYAVISYSARYYGEMLTYLGMTAPMAALALVSWLSHPFQGKTSEVEVRRMPRREAVLMLLAAVPVTAGFGLLLALFHTANLAPSILSVTTSFVAAYLTFRRSPYFALAYAANDVVLILLWILAGRMSMVVCFALFLASDLYGFFSWLRMERRQKGH